MEPGESSINDEQDSTSNNNNTDTSEERKYRAMESPPEEIASNNNTEQPIQRQDTATDNTFSSLQQQKSTTLVQDDEIAVYIQRSTLQWDDFIYFLTNVEPARFNFPKPPNLNVSDDSWAALKLRVDNVARSILDPHRYYAAGFCVGILITIVCIYILFFKKDVPHTIPLVCNIQWLSQLKLIGTLVKYYVWFAMNN